MKKKYGVGNLILDLILLSITGGLWGIVILWRIMRNLGSEE